MNRRAFSLIELSVVIVIIGLLVVGVTKGVTIVRSGRIAAARTITANSQIGTISGLIAWYETSLMGSVKSNESIDGAQISEWRDINPPSVLEQKNKMTKTAGSNLVYLADGINHLPSMQFSSSGIISLSNFYQGNSVQNTIFIVFSPTVAPSASEMTLLDSYSSASTSSVGIKNNAISLNAGFAVSTGTATNSASFSNRGAYIIAAYLDSSRSRAYVNNATTSAGNSQIDAGTNPLTGLTVGANKLGASSFTGLISEIIIFDHVLQIDQRKAVMSYLSKKYRIYVTAL